MGKNLIAHASISISAPVSEVWQALITPSIIKQYMFGTNVISDWKEGSKIIWKGEWKGKTYEDKGLILQLKPEKILQYSHFSPLSGDADLPENYHKVTIELSEENFQTIVVLSQDNNSTEEAQKHSESNWQMMLETLKKFLEK